MRFPSPAEQVRRNKSGRNPPEGRDRRSENLPRATRKARLMLDPITFVAGCWRSQDQPIIHRLIPENSRNSS